jgi:hypothetical protein
VKSPGDSGYQMGYETRFDGKFTLDRPLTPEHKSVLEELAQEEHVLGEDGKPLREASSGRPCVYCQWTPTADGTGIVWDMGEKFYGWLEWLEYIIQHQLRPQGYALNGEVRWRGTNADDSGVIFVKDNRVEAVPDVNPGPSWDRKFTPIK